MLHGKAIIYISSSTEQTTAVIQGANLWNSIPEDLKNTKSQYSIKKKFLKNLLSQQCLENV